MKHSCQKTWKNTVENGQQAKQSEIKLLIQESSKLQDFIVYTGGSVTKDQSGWGFTVKQGGTTIHEDKTSSLTMEVEAVTLALRWIALGGDNQTTHAINLTYSMSLLQKVKSGMESPDWNVSMVNIHLRKLLRVYCPGHTGMKGNDRADRLVEKAAMIEGLRLEGSEMLRSFRHYLRAESRGHHTIDHLQERRKRLTIFL